MQLPLENSSNPTVDAAGPSSPQKVAPIVNTFLGRARETPTFLEMLDNLSDSPVRRPRDAANGPQAPVLVDATMDGLDPPVAMRDPPTATYHLTRCEFTIFSFFLLHQFTRNISVYPSGANTSSVQPPIPANLVKPITPSGMVAEYQVTLVGPVIGIFVHW